MKIGFCGCGKLGLMVALTIESRGHEVKGYDINPAIAEYLEKRAIPFREEHSEELLANTKMEMLPLEELCEWADILFLAPQTPHAPEYEGDRALPQDRRDFDYTYLKACIKQVGRTLRAPKVCVLISTVLPGTLERDVVPHCNPYIQLVYEPLFIAIGTVYHDFLHPEFVLVGATTDKAVRALRGFYSQIFPLPGSDYSPPLFVTDLRTAEGIKVLYNTFITAKTVLANTYGELAHRTGMNVDHIFQCLSLATDRLLSPKYLKAGMGDGGGCHPRDNIALSWLARETGMSYDIFSSLMQAREEHTRWLANLIVELKGDLPVFLLGRSFKPETDIETGSPAVLLSRMLTAAGVKHSSDNDLVPTILGLYFIATQHARFATYRFPAG